MFEKLSIVIPAYNEASTIYKILDKIAAVDLPNNLSKEIVIVDDCSTDETSPSIEKYIEKNSGLNIILHKHAVNKGKGAALHTAIGIASGDIIVVQDADLEYDPNEYSILLKPILDDMQM